MHLKGKIISHTNRHKHLRRALPEALAKGLWRKEMSDEQA